MAWLAGGSSLATVVQRLQGAGGAAYSGDWVSAAAGGAAAAGKAVEYFAKTKTGLKDALDKVGKKVLPTPTAIIDGAMLAIFLVDLLNGLSSPDTGSAFSTAKDKYENVKLNLEAANPDELRWTGEAADAYKAMNDALRSLVQQMEELDKQMKNLVADQAGKVKQAHMCVTVSTLVLTACLGVAMALYLIPITGPEISCAFQIVAAFGACASVFAFEMFTLSNSMSISHSVDALSISYGELAGRAQTEMAGTFGEIKGEVAAKTASQLSSFTAVSDGLSAFAAAPTIQSLANTSLGRESASPAQRVLLDAASEAHATSSTDTAAQAPSETAPAAPAFAPPSPAQTAQMAQASSALSQPVNQVSQTVGQAQQLAASARGQGAAGDAPAAKAADEAGAASGAAGAERAPVEVAEAGAEAGADRPGRVL